jgi:hypothetical protein
VIVVGEDVLRMEPSTRYSRRCAVWSASSSASTSIRMLLELFVLFGVVVRTMGSLITPFDDQGVVARWVRHDAVIV